MRWRFASTDAFSTRMKLPGLITLLLPAHCSFADDAVSWHRQVSPILKANCVSCHKPGKSRGGLDLTTHAALLLGGKDGAVVMPGDAKAGKLVEAIGGDEPEMPKDGEPLMAAEVEIITRWISQGAKEDAPADTGEGKPAQPPVYAALPAVQAMAFSPDGGLLAVTGRHEILLHKADGSGIAARLSGDSPRLEALTFSSDGAVLAACGGAASGFGEVQLWDVAKRELVRSVKASHDSFFGVAISPDKQRVAVGCADKLVRVFTLADGKEVMKCDNHIDWVFGAAFTGDGQRLATVSRDKAAKLIDIATGRLIDDINRPRDPLLCLARHPKAELVATGGTDGRIRLFKMEPRGGRLSEGDDKENSFVREFEHMASPIHAIAFSPDGTLVACAGQSGEVRIFKSESGQRVAQIKGDHGPVFALAFAADGKRLGAGGYDGKIRLHETEKGAIVKEFDSVPLR
jgi:Planctomycete cytochrome C/Anaphase-promoting complex subunit 4 WD40 domain